MNLRKAIASAESQQLDMEQSLKDSGVGKGIGGSGYAGSDGVVTDASDEEDDSPSLDTSAMADDIKLNQITMHEAMEIAQECFGVNDEALKMYAERLMDAQQGISSSFPSFESFQLTVSNEGIGETIKAYAKKFIEWLKEMMAKFKAFITGKKEPVAPTSKEISNAENALMIISQRGVSNESLTDADREHLSRNNEGPLSLHSQIFKIFRNPIVRNAMGIEGTNESADYVEQAHMATAAIPSFVSSRALEDFLNEFAKMVDRYKQTPVNFSDLGSVVGATNHLIQLTNGNFGIILKENKIPSLNANPSLHDIETSLHAIQMMLIRIASPLRRKGGAEQLDQFVANVAKIDPKRAVSQLVNWSRSSVNFNKQLKNHAPMLEKDINRLSAIATDVSNTHYHEDDSTGKVMYGIARNYSLIISLITQLSSIVLTALTEANDAVHLLSDFFERNQSSAT